MDSLGSVKWVQGIKFKRYTCLNQNNERKDFGNVINLYVVMTRNCNAHCKFCEYAKGCSDIDLDLFKQRYIELCTRASIGTVHFTGGEPSLELDKVREIARFVKQVNHLTLTSINTNGVRLGELLEVPDLDNIALSRHHFNDEISSEIFGDTQNKLPSTEYISSLSDKDKAKLHLSCNIIKGYIDNPISIKAYVDWAASIGIKDIGLVGLMGINEYCRERAIRLQDLNIPGIEGFKMNRYFRNINSSGVEVCHCNNYLYTAPNLNLLSIYYRHTLKNTEIADFLVYEDNHIMQGFNGNMLI